MVVRQKWSSHRRISHHRWFDITDQRIL